MSKKRQADNEPDFKAKVRRLTNSNSTNLRLEHFDKFFPEGNFKKILIRENETTDFVESVGKVLCDHRNCSNRPLESRIISCMGKAGYHKNTLKRHIEHHHQKPVNTQSVRQFFTKPTAEKCDKNQYQKIKEANCRLIASNALSKRAFETPGFKSYFEDLAKIFGVPELTNVPMSRTTIDTQMSATADEVKKLIRGKASMLAENGLLSIQADHYSTRRATGESEREFLSVTLIARNQKFEMTPIPLCFEPSSSKTHKQFRKDLKRILKSFHLWKAFNRGLLPLTVDSALTGSMAVPRKRENKREWMKTIKTDLAESDDEPDDIPEPDNWFTVSCAAHDTSNIIKWIVKDLGKSLPVSQERELKKIETFINSCDKRGPRRNSDCAKSFNDYTSELEIQPSHKIHMAKIRFPDYENKTDSDQQNLLRRITKYPKIDKIYQIRFRSLIDQYKSVLMNKPVIQEIACRSHPCSELLPDGDLDWSLIESLHEVFLLLTEKLNYFESKSASISKHFESLLEVFEWTLDLPTPTNPRQEIISYVKDVTRTVVGNYIFGENNKTTRASRMSMAAYILWFPNRNMKFDSIKSRIEASDLSTLEKEDLIVQFDSLRSDWISLAENTILRIAEATAESWQEPNIESSQNLFNNDTDTETLFGINFDSEADEPTSTALDDLERYRKTRAGDFRAFLIRQKTINADADSLVRRFWDENKSLYPKLSKAAKIILTTSPSCSTIERYFSEVSGMLTPDRNRLTAKSIFELSLVHFAPAFKTAITSHHPDQ